MRLRPLAALFPVRQMLGLGGGVGGGGPLWISHTS